MFVIVAGQTYRTGTTFVQRLLNCTDECMIYGEQNELIPRLYSSLLGYIQKETTERSHRQWAEFKKEKNIWSANIQPNIRTVLQQYINLLEGLYNTSPYDHVGFKQILLRPTDIDMLYNMFRDTLKIVYCTRNYDDAYASYKQMYDFISEEKFKQYYDASVKIAKSDKMIFLHEYENISHESCEAVLDFVGCTNKSNIDKVLNLKIREEDNYVNPKFNQEKTDQPATVDGI